MLKTDNWVMVMKSKIWILLSIIMLMLNSCYYRELVYSFDRSTGGVYADSLCYYLARVREYRNPKGISRFPDGGQVKVLRQLFGLFRTDTMNNRTEMAAILADVKGWPSRYKSRLEKNGTDIAIGILNISFPDTVNGIYLYNLRSGRILKYSGEGDMPTLSKTGTRIAYCRDKMLLVEDYSDKTPINSYSLDTVPVFLSWKDENKILLYCSDPFRVMVLDLKDGALKKSGMDYIPNYGQEVGATEIRIIVERSSPDLKRFLDNR